MGFFKKTKKKDAADTHAAPSSAEQPDVKDEKKDKKEKKAKRAKPRRKDEMLSSVLNESEPGAAIDVMRSVPNFAIPKDVIPRGGYLVMVLPTDDPSFGGLNKKQNRNEDKGLIINLMQAGDIEIAVTEDMLEDNSLAIIPTPSTLERLDEFTLLREARYLWGIAVTDPDSEALVIYTVPSIGATDNDRAGKLYDSAAAISRGDKDIVDVVDMYAIKAMWDIFMTGGVDYGMNGLNEAVLLVMEAYAIRQAEGKVASSEEILKVLYHHFPAIDPNHGEGDDDTDETDGDDTDRVSANEYVAPEDEEQAPEVVGETGAVTLSKVSAPNSADAFANVPGDNDGTGDEADDTDAAPDTEDAPAADDDENVAADAGDTGDSSADDGVTDEQADADDAEQMTEQNAKAVANHDDEFLTPIGDVSAPDGHDGDEMATEGVGVDFGDEPDSDDDAVDDDDQGDQPDTTQTVAPIDTQALVASIVENMPREVSTQLSDADIDRLTERQMPMIMQMMMQAGMVNPAGNQPQRLGSNGVALSAGSEDNDIDAKVRENYLRDDLGLSVDTSMFDETFYGHVPKLTFSPYMSQTEWLNEPLAEMVNAINAELETNYMNRREVYRDKYVTMLGKVIKLIDAEVSVNNKDSRYYQMQQAADSDREAMARNRDVKVAERRKEIEENYDAKRTQYIERRMAEIGQEFDRNNRADLDNDLRLAEYDMNAVSERLYDSMIHEINRKRREEAQRRYTLSQHELMAVLSPNLDEILQEEAQDLHNAVEAVKDYLDDKSRDDMKRADIIAERLERDNRVEEIRADADSQISAAREHADVEIKRIQDAMTTLRAEHKRFIDELNADNDVRVANAERQIVAINKERDNDREHLESIRQRLNEEYEAKKAAAQDQVEQYKANMEALEKSQKSDYTTIIITMVVLSIVMLVAGVALSRVIF